ncbi:MAG: triphosphoribosyl-dephospho-CoA synthase [Methanomicrobiaceae archaeon]|nr:triphosphoribosyl-dephospho-CoA synthase [Methanomicrobiaceae archaeon]
MNDCPPLSRTARAQLAMMLEVCASPKPGNVDRCHDYADTRLEHFLASAILARPALERAERGEGGIGALIRQAVALTACHAGGNTHFGAYILLFPLILGGDIAGACAAVRQTTVADSLAFYEAFGATKVRMLEEDAEIDVNDPKAVATIRERGMTLDAIMAYSAPRDMVAREWTNDFALTRKAADYLCEGAGRQAIVDAFVRLLAKEIDTFVAKKHGPDVAEWTRREAGAVLAGERSLEGFDEECLARGINPGSIADLVIAGIYVALGEGWQWDC